MKFFLFMFNLIFFNAYFAIAKTELWLCDNKKFKIVMPLIGFNKIYIEQGDAWKKVVNFNITDDKFILYNQKPKLKKNCSNKECKVDFHISRILTSGNFSDYTSKVSNEFCEIDGAGICFKRSLNKNLEKGYCSQVIYKN